MTKTMLPLTASTPSRLAMPAYRSACVPGIAAAVIGADVRDRVADQSPAFAGDAREISAWSPPTS